MNRKTLLKVAAFFLTALTISGCGGGGSTPSASTTQAKSPLTLDLSIQSAPSSPAGTATASVVLSSNNPGRRPTVMIWTIDYPSANFSGVTETIGTDAATGGTRSLLCNKTPGRMICAIYGDRATIPVANPSPSIPDGEVARFVFQSSKPAGTISNIQISNVTAVEVYAHPIDVSTQTASGSMKSSSIEVGTHSGFVTSF